MSQNGTQTTARPDPEVRPKAKHRQFTAEYKKRILDEADDCCFMPVVARASPSTTLSSIVGNLAGPCAGKRIPPYRFCRGTT